MLRTLRLVLPAVFALALAGSTLPAGANHNADLHSPNVQILDTEPQPNFTNSDLAFWGNRVYAANYGGFRIFDITNGANPSLVFDYTGQCHGPQNDISVWNTDADPNADLLFLSVDSVKPNNACAADTTTIASEVGDAQAPGWEGVRIFDINTETAPVLLANVPTDCGSHTHTLVPTDDGVGMPDPGTKLYVYVSSYPTSGRTNDVDFANEGASYEGVTADRMVGTRTNGQECLEPESRPDSALGQWEGNRGHNKISIISVDITSTATIQATDNPIRRTEGPAGPDPAIGPCDGAGPADTCLFYPNVLEVGMPTGTRMTHLAAPSRTSEFTACHDISVFIELDLAAGSCWDEGILWDITNPAAPDFVRRLRLDPVDLLFHSVTFSWDGKVLAFEDEAGGGTDDRCRSSGDLQGRMWFTDPDLNVLGSFKIPRPQPVGENCTAHLYNFIPQDNDRDILVSAWYKGGTSVADATQPAQTKEIGFYDAQGGAGTTDDSDVWSSYWYNGFIYINDIQRGLETAAFNDARKEDALSLPFFNPQTQMNLIPQTPPKCGKRAAQIFGTSERDVLEGSDEPEIYQALGGNDVVTGEGGNDRACGGSNNDKVKGQENSDRLFGEQGKDRLNGGTGNDILVGGPGRDVCVGGPGTDRARKCEREVGIEK